MATTRTTSGQSAANLQKFLKGADYPATKDNLMDLANENGAPDEIMDILDQFPDDVEFEGVTDVQECYADVEGNKRSFRRGSSERSGEQSRSHDTDLDRDRQAYEDRRRKRQAEQRADDDAWDHRLKGHETQAIKEAREMKHGYDGRGRVTDPEEDKRLQENATPAIQDAREMKHGYDGRGRVRKFGPGDTDESIADDRERYEERQAAASGEAEVDPETGSHSKRRKDDEGHVIRGERMTWQERYGRTGKRDQGGEAQQPQASGRKTWKQLNSGK